MSYRCAPDHYLLYAAFATTSSYLFKCLSLLLQSSTIRLSDGAVFFVGDDTSDDDGTAAAAAAAASLTLADID